MNKCNKKLFAATVKCTLNQLKEQKALHIIDAVQIAQKSIHSYFKGKNKDLEIKDPSNTKT